MTSPDAGVAMREAMAAHKAGRFAEAEAGYRSVLVSKPADPKAHYYLGLLHFHRGETNRALEHMRQCVRYAPNHPHAWNTLGAMFIEAGSRPEATQAYRRATETAPDMGEGWHNLGICLRDEGDFEGAIACLRTAVARQPDYARAYEALGLLLYQLERVPEASQVYGNWLSVDPANPTARHMAAATSQQDIPARAGDEYVRKLFDDSAGTFDVGLGRLGYRAPHLVASALATCAHGRLLAAALDAGCGTGLCGPLLREHVQKLVGIDLSPRMIERSTARGCYDELAVSELSLYMRSHPGEFDAVISADTLVYFGDLQEPLCAARETLRTGGFLIFTLEALSDSAAANYKLEAHGRYAHSEGYVQRSVQESGLELQTLTTQVLRQERAKDVTGFLVVSRKA